jgi:hypothetical protein
MMTTPGTTSWGMTGEYRHDGRWRVGRTPPCLAGAVIADAGMANIGMANIGMADAHPRIRRALE